MKKYLVHLVLNVDCFVYNFKHALGHLIHGVCPMINSPHQVHKCDNSK
jgi:hypothetical protein